MAANPLVRVLEQLRDRSYRRSSTKPFQRDCCIASNRQTPKCERALEERGELLNPLLPLEALDTVDIAVVLVARDLFFLHNSDRPNDVAKSSPDHATLTRSSQESTSGFSHLRRSWTPSRRLRL